MSWHVLAARARGLGTRSGLASGSPLVVEHAIRARTMTELALLARWSGDSSALLPIFLDEDRRTLRAMARALVANVAPSQRVAAAIFTPTLSARRVAAVAQATSFAEIRAALGDHALAPAFAANELFDVEHGLARCYFEVPRHHDKALQTFIAQLADLANATTALMVVSRKGELDAHRLFVSGGRRLDRTSFVAACHGTEDAHQILARTFVCTPLAAALWSADPAALDDAGLAWQLATQLHLRRLEPLGLAPALWFVLHRRDEARRARRAAWTLRGAS